MASRSVRDILGGRKPAVDDLNSKIDEGSGVMEVELIPTCAATEFKQIKLTAIRVALFKGLFREMHTGLPDGHDLALVFINQDLRI